MNASELAANFEDGVWYNEQTHGDLGFIGKHVLSKITRGTSFRDFTYHFTLFSVRISTQSGTIPGTLARCPIAYTPLLRARWRITPTLVLCCFKTCFRLNVLGLESVGVVP